MSVFRPPTDLTKAVTASKLATALRIESRRPKNLSL
ncbi:hypothetical protein JDF658_24940, partial [Carboxydocella sp. JDF658]